MTVTATGTFLFDRLGLDAVSDVLRDGEQVPRLCGSFQIGRSDLALGLEAQLS